MGWESRLDEAARQWNEERSSIVAAAEETRSVLESRIESLEGVVRDWGYDDVDNWWRDGDVGEDHGGEDEGPHQPGSSSRVTEEGTNNTARRETPAVAEVRSEDNSAVAVGVASMVAVLSVSLMTQAHWSYHRSRHREK